MNVLKSATHPDAFAPEALDTFADLGPGFHMIPASDHCRDTSHKYRVTYRHLVANGDVDVWSQDFDNEAAARRDIEITAREWPGTYTMRLTRPRRIGSRFPSKRRERHAEFMASRYDAMAIQAAMILRGALADLREAC